MPITQLDSAAALLVIDLQKGIVSRPTAHPVRDILSRAGALAAAFRRRALPVVLVNVTGGAPGRVQEVRKLGELPADWAELVPELNRQPQDHTVTKRTWGAFTHTDLAMYLHGRGVTQVIIAGISTSAGVESTARHAQELGFNVVFAVDAMTDANPDTHHHSLTRIFPRVGELGTTEEILGLLE